MEPSRIRQLPPDVIGQIAAGEVVERPAAAIKELVENSMDAGATAITVDIKEGGLNSFRVSDNGSGIRPEDIKLAFARHATSKIRTAEDLYGVKSLGFRGEALASIAAVSRVTCLTRAKGQESGLSVRNEGGEILEIRDAACPEGTTFTVKDLFFNAPVRRKFLKKPATETAHVSELMARLILSHPAISFRFMADGKLVYFSAGDGKIESAVMSVYGMPTLKLLTKVEGNMNGILLSGYVGVGDAGRGNRSHEHFFLNGRAMKSGILSAAVETACRQRVTIGRFPMCILHLDMPFEATDVNVHPNKWEVRFQDERAVRQAVETIVFEALEKTNLSPVLPPLYLETKPEAAPARVQVTEPVAPPIKIQAVTPVSQTNREKKLSAFGVESAPLPKFTPAEASVSVAPAKPVSSALRETSAAMLPPKPVLQVQFPKDLPFRAAVSPAPKAPVSLEQPASTPISFLPKENEIQQTQDALVEMHFAHKPLKIIGVAFNTYILMEYDDILILCDQHAVHERLLYEKFMKETASAPASQAMLVPLIVSLSKAEYAVYEENEEALRKAGFDLSPMGDDTVQMRGVPIVLGQPQAEKCLMEALDALMHDARAPIADRTSRVIQMACKHAVKGGERLPEESVIALIRDVMEQKVTPTCPHGRPLMVQLSHTELDKRFRRIQN
ncbi:MAG: DNA mismatch repair endonuclease MutL [Clostridia bacterium]|nr:DNA mismatch repair endonuclease MutL [Clostridia bacterium]